MLKLFPLMLIATLLIPFCSAQDDRIVRLENYLVGLYDSNIGLVRESSDPTIDNNFWLLSDNLLAMHALKNNHPDISARINETMQKYNRWTDGVHESIFGETIPTPPISPDTIRLERISEAKIMTEERHQNYAHQYMIDWVDYADLLLYASLSYYNAGQTDLAKHYFRMAVDMWNDAGLYDKPTREDGFFTLYKMGLLLYVSLLLDEPLPYKARLEDLIWSMQREDGGLRTQYKVGKESGSEANSETASIVLLAYQLQEDVEKAKAEAEDREREEREAQDRQKWIMMILIVIAVVAVIIVSVVIIVLRR